MMSENHIIDLEADEKILLKAALPYAQAFLDEMDAFYPFAMILDRDNVVSILSPDIDDEYPSSDYLIRLYETAVQNAFLAEGAIYRSAIICIDVVVYDGEDKNAIECRFLHERQEVKTHCVYYEKQGESYLLKKE